MRNYLLNHLDAISLQEVTNTFQVNVVDTRGDIHSSESAQLDPRAYFSFLHESADIRGLYTYRVPPILKLIRFCCDVVMMIIRSTIR